MIIEGLSKTSHAKRKDSIFYQIFSYLLIFKFYDLSVDELRQMILVKI